jgi:hypothetical protein
MVVVPEFNTKIMAKNIGVHDWLECQANAVSADDCGSDKIRGVIIVAVKMVQDVDARIGRRALCVGWDCSPEEARPLLLTA